MAKKQLNKVKVDLDNFKPVKKYYVVKEKFRQAFNINKYLLI